MSDTPSGTTRIHRRGQLLFALIFVLFSGFLLISYPAQTTWAEKTRLFAQPGFWPAVGVGGMFGFGLLHALQLKRKRFVRTDWDEGKRWLQVFEFAAWFLVYVFAVPVIGYVFGSLIFLPALIWRMGYRSRRMLWTAAALALAIVLLFKGFLDVKIPGGALYDYFPGAMRSFFILRL